MFWLPGAPDSADRPGFCSERLLGLYIEKDEKRKGKGRAARADGRVENWAVRAREMDMRGPPWMVTCPSSVGGRQRARHIELMLLCMHLPFLSFYFKI